MELDDLRRSWAEHDRRLDEALRLNRRLLAAMDLDKARSMMQRMRTLLGIELVVDVLAVVALGSFIGSHLMEPRFLVPALVLNVAAVGIFAAELVQWMRAGEVNYDAPVLEIQRRLEALRVLRIRTMQVVLLLAPLLWTPLLIVGMRAGLNLDAYELLGTRYLIANLVFGLMLMAAVLWASRRFADRLDRSSLVRRMARDIAGKSLSSAMDQLARLTAFEREEHGGSEVLGRDEGQTGR